MYNSKRYKLFSKTTPEVFSSQLHYVPHGHIYKWSTSLLCISYFMLNYIRRFTDNTGPYVVNLRLTETQAQSLLFRYNSVTRNEIIPSETMLKPRSRARAVAVISSRYLEWKLSVVPSVMSDVAAFLKLYWIIASCGLHWPMIYNGALL